MELTLESNHDFLWVEWTTFRRRYDCPERLADFLLPYRSQAFLVLGLLLVRGGLYFLMTPSKQCFITISRGLLRGCTLDFFLMCSLGHGNGKSLFIVLDFLL